MTKLLEQKFILAAASILIGAALVPFDQLDGSIWSAMTTTLVMGFFGVTGWQGQQQVSQRQAEVQMAQMGEGRK